MLNPCVGRQELNQHPVNSIEMSALPEEDGGGFLVTFPGLPGCVADGETIEQAIREAVDAEQSWLRTHEELALPQVSGKFVLRLPKSLHTELSARARLEGVSMNTLAVSFLAASMNKAHTA